MRELHDKLLMSKGKTSWLHRFGLGLSDEEGAGETRQHKHRLGQSLYDFQTATGLVNNTMPVSVPYYAGLGFLDGVFSENGGSNVTACRLNSVRFGNNVTLLAWYAQIRYGVDKIMLYTTELAQQLYPFSFHCYYTADEAQKLTQ